MPTLFSTFSSPRSARISAASMKSIHPGSWCLALLGTPICTLLLAGCGGGINQSPTSSKGTGTAAGNITGNWQATTTPTTGPALGTLSGSIDQSGGITSSGQFTTGVLHASSVCFTASPNIPIQGFVDASAVSLNSFQVNQMYLGLTATLNPSGVLQTGNYTVHGGCADGSSGGFTATRYAAFTGTYSGSVGTYGTSSRILSLTSLQASVGNGSGDFDVSGTTVFTGFSCFTHGTVQFGSKISGAAFSLLLSTDDTQGGQVTLTGTIDSAAQQVTLTAYQVSGGACNGQSGVGALTIQQ